MKTLKQQLEKIPNLSEQSKTDVFTKANELTHESGVAIVLEECCSDNVKLSLEFVNGKRIPKHELLESTYNLFRKNLPEKYRITIKI